MNWIAALVLASLSMVTRAQTIEYVHTDPLGSPVAITNQAGQVIERIQYEPFGTTLAAGNSDRPGYTGHVMDSLTLLTYMQQRYYDTNLGRFLSVDPVTADLVTGWNFNRYSYAANNPHKFTDPDGRSIWTKLIKLVIKGGDVAATTAGLVSDGKTVMNPAASTGERILAGASIASEALPFSVGDAKDVAQIVRARFPRESKSKVDHIFDKRKVNEGHIAPRTEASKERAAKLFESVAGNPANKRTDLPVDQNKIDAGVEMHTQQFKRGQVWVESREGKIIDAGVNRTGAER